MMKKLILFSILIFMSVSVFAADVEPLVFKPTDKKTSDSMTFTVTFTGATYTEIGFSKIQTSVTAGQGLIKSDIENNTLTLTQNGKEKTDTNGIYYYSYKDDSSYYIYWYLSLQNASVLTLAASASKGNEYNITTKKDDGTTEKVKIPGNSFTVSLDTYVYGTDPTAPTETTDVSLKSGSTVKVATFEQGYAVYKGNSEFKITSATVYQYPDNRNIGTLTLTLETSA